MSSVKQVTANRANAQLSTGPKTAAGKRKSRMNAVKHGLSAQTIVVGDEDPAEFEVLRENLEQDFQPETYLERELLQRLSTRYVFAAFRCSKPPAYSFSSGPSVRS